ncbi:uncharacterized protein [Anoplolepis gracilipes]|uniref:uncharacterized protein n=1 Tax=Anoplolepis gracilipes TaxID=354296 RepID=UPI003BA177C4
MSDKEDISVLGNDRDVNSEYAISENDNVSPTIEKLIRMMKMQNSSISENSLTPTKRLFSPNYRTVNKANDDPAVFTPTRKRLDSTFSSPKALTIREYSMNSSPTLKATMIKEIKPPVPQMVQAPCKHQEFIDSNDEKEETIYVSEVHFLLMASNRNRMRKMVACRRPRRDSEDSAFSELMESD